MPLGVNDFEVQTYSSVKSRKGKAEIPFSSTCVRARMQRFDSARAVRMCNARASAGFSGPVSSGLPEAQIGPARQTAGDSCVANWRHSIFAHVEINL